MKALITGVTGFVGSHLADYLLGLKNLEVHGVRRPRSRDEFVTEGVTYHNGDVTDFFSMAELVSGLKPNYLFHLAAQSDVRLSWDAPKATLEGNIIGTLNVLEAVRRFSADTIVHFAGSSEEYGQVTPRECPITEKQPLRPLSPYAVSKVAADLLCQQYVKSFGIHVIITRAFNHTGPRRGANFVTSKIARNLALIKLGQAEPVLKLGNMEAVRDFSDVRDIVRAYWLAVQLCDAGTPYNIGSGDPRSVAFIYTTLEGIAKVKVKIEQDPAMMRPSDVPYLSADPRAFKKATGWKQEYELKQTLTDLFNYWMEKLG
jgi:GDP-4-dehydro-6-deoxy-D-mannose reductase